MAGAVQRRAGNLSAYRDQQFQGSLQEQEEKLRKSSTLYVGNLSFFTTEDQIYHLFAKSGDVKRVVMGLDRFNRTPCGFCFVEYYTRSDAEDAIRYVSGTRLDERIVRCDWDAGFIEGRQYGRGKSGGQVRDEFRDDYDSGRGGFGKLIQHRVDKFGPVGFEGGPSNRRFERGKRKWQEDENGEETAVEGQEGATADGDSAEQTTDLRLKLQKIREDRATNENADPLAPEESTDEPSAIPGQHSDITETAKNTSDGTDDGAKPTLSDEKTNRDAEMESADAAEQGAVSATDPAVIAEEMETES